MLWVMFVLCYTSVSVCGLSVSIRHNITDNQDGIPICGENEIMTYDKNICPPKSCETLFASYQCVDAPPEPGCDCIDGFLRNDAGVCIPKEKCPKKPIHLKCGPNEIATFDRIVCPPQTCEGVYTLATCGERYPEPGCDCIENYLRNASGICIPSEECPPPPILPKCGYNEMPTTDRAVCPPQVCESIYTSYTCELRPPEPGCVCIDNHLRNASGICIPSQECPSPPYVPVQPICSENEEATDNKITCPPQTCESKYTMYSCLLTYPEPGCNCVAGYLRNSSGVCIPSEDCPAPVYNITCGEFEIKRESRTQCPPQTCDSLYSINFCLPGLPEPGCDCLDGFLRDEGGVCIPKEECPLPPGYSDGDINDYTDDYSDSSCDEILQTDSRSSSETKSHLYNSENSLHPSDKSKLYEASTSKNYSISKSNSFSANSSNSSNMEIEYDY
nr:zonadhesin 3 [Ephestia kuehniella]